MIIDLKKLKRSGKDQAEFFFEYCPQAELLNLPDAEIESPVKINGTVTLTGEHSAYIDGQVLVVISGDCTRCLSHVKKEFLLDFSEAVENNNPDGYPVVNDTVDLSKIVDDLIAINCPITFLCSDDCKGLCSGCGVNLNDQQCKCKNK